MSADRGRRSALTDERRRLLEGRLAGRVARTRNVVPPVVATPRDGPLPLADGQRRLWLLDQLVPGTPAYNVPAAYQWEGPLDVDHLVRALTTVVGRHEALRTTFGWSAEHNEPIQVVGPARVPVELVDLSDRPLEAAERETWELVVDAATRSFDLERGPLLDVRVIRRAPHDHVLLLTLHHICADGWALGLLVRELGIVYAAYVAGADDPGLPPVAIQPADHAEWERDPAVVALGDEQLAYWRTQLRGVPPVLDLPSERRRPVLPTFDAGSVGFEVPAAAMDALRDVARAGGATMFMALLAAFQGVISRLSGEDDIAVGTAIAGRSRSELQDVVGFLANTLVLRTDCSGDPSFAELVSRAREVVVGAFGNQDVSFGRVVEDLAPPRDLTRNPLTQVWFNVVAPIGTEVRFGDVTLRVAPSPMTVTRFDLEAHLAETGVGLLVYSTALFDEERVASWAQALGRVLEAVADDPSLPLSRWPILGPAERELVVDAWNDTAAPWSEDATLIDLFLGAVERGPDAIALVDVDGTTWTFATLAERAAQIARRLRDAGAGAESVVGILLDRSVDMVAAVLGVLGADAAYLPLDPDHPDERLAFLLGDAAAGIVVTSAARGARIPSGPLVVVLDDLGDDGADGWPRRVAGPDALAYVIHTSGSTGRPKGVACSHRPLVNVLDWIVARLAPGLRSYQMFSLTSDASYYEMAIAWSTGGAVVLATEEARRSGAGMAAELVDLDVERVVVPVVTLAQLADDGRPIPSLRELIVTGDQMVVTDAVRGWLEAMPGLTVENHYGPTEAHVVTGLRLDEDVSAWPVLPSIGTPISNVRTYVVDEWLAPVPVGVVGEIVLGGPFLARGYVGRPGVTAGVFVPDPLAGDGSRLYRTGDLGRWRADGTIDYLGRTDFQVKVRGYRIEPGEVEAELLRHPAVTDAVVVAIDEGTGDRRLVGYVVAPTRPSTTALRAHLKQRLPGHMVPSRLVVLDALPLTASGKVDRKALPEPDGGRPDLDQPFLPPTNPTEEALVAIWAEVLGLEQVGVTDDFFELGGHSLAATQVVSRVRAALAVDIPLRAMFEASTVAELALVVDGAERTAAPPLVPVRRDGRLPLSFAQWRLWFLDQLVPGSPAYNIPAAYRLSGALDLDALELAVTDVVARHEVLRTTFAFSAEDGEPHQVVAEPAPVVVPVLEVADPDAVAALVAEEAVRPFDLAVGPLLRVSLLRLGVGEHVLLVTMHHVCSDGWSLTVFNGELAVAYAAYASGASSSGLAPLAVQYADYAVWQRQWLSGDALESQIAYWRDRLAGAPPALELPADRPRPPVPTFDAGVVGFSVPAEAMAGLREVGRAQGATLFMTLLTAFQGVLSRLTGEDDIVVGSPTAGRNQVEVEQAIGFFVNTMVLRTDCSGDPSFAELVARVRETALGAYAHQDLPFEQLVEHVAPRRDLSRNPLVQVWFHLVDDSVDLLGLPGLGTELVTADIVTTRFDLEVHVSGGDDGLVGWLVFNRALFDEGSVRGWAGVLERVLGVVAGDPGLRLSGWPVVSDVDRGLAAGWADGGVGSSVGASTLSGVFAEAAGRWPERVAVVDVDGVEVSFAGLSARAGGVAERLRELGVGPECVVGVCLDRSVDLWAAVLGVLAAGAAYLPLDPALPADRVALMLEEAGASVVVTSVGLAPVGVTALFVEDVTAGGWPERCADAGSLAYVIFTSGSTGRPKGIAMAHGPVVNLLGWQTARQGATQRTLQFSAVSFDISIQEVFSTWAAGGAVVLVSEEDRADPAGLARLIAAGAVDRLFVPPLVLEQLADTAIVTAVTEIATAGDQLQLGEGIRAWLPDGVVVENHYGPSEAHVVTALRLEGEIDRWPVLPSIGTPIAGVRVEIVDEWLQPVPVGVTGEILVGGPHLARGYVGRPGLTGASFVPDEGGGRRYRTGDLGRWRPEGSIEFLGRADFQVKVRGYRIEPGEIEAQLLAHPAVTETVVIAAPDPAGDRRLIAYLTTTGDAAPSTSELRGHLRQRLPDYMIPAQFIVLDAFPLTTAGKLDRARLPEPDGTRPTLDRPYQAPATPTETLLTTIWADVLDLDTIGVLDDFFDLGGHSLLATQITARIRTTFQTDLPLRTIFETPTITDLATTIDAGGVDPSQRQAAQERMLARTLADDVRPRPARVTRGPATLVTGGTGFLGSYVVAEVLRTTNGPVHCLVRGDDGLDKLRRALADDPATVAEAEAHGDRLHVVIGDLATPRLGLSDEDWEHLAATCGTIYHCGGEVHALKTYDQLAPANVDATEHVLRLAAAGTGTHVCHVSTLAVAPTGHEDPDRCVEQPISEQRRVADADDVITAGFGYAQTKWVAERLVTTARERGIGVTTVRLARVVGSAASGHHRATDRLVDFLGVCASTGVAIRSASIDLWTPVDVVARAIVALTEADAGAGGTGGTYHVPAAEVGLDDVLDELNEVLGGALTPTSILDWADDTGADGAQWLVDDRPVTTRVAEDDPDGTTRFVIANGRQVRFDAGTSALAHRPDVVPVTVDAPLVRRLLEDLVRRGVLTSPGG